MRNTAKQATCAQSRARIAVFTYVHLLFFLIEPVVPDWRVSDARGPGPLRGERVHGEAGEQGGHGHVDWTKSEKKLMRTWVSSRGKKGKLSHMAHKWTV